MAEQLSDQVDVNKGGETKLSFELTRSAQGLTLRVRAIPEVEEFMRSISAGEFADVRKFGRHWLPKDASKTLSVYLPNPAEVLAPRSISRSLAYRLDRMGLPLSAQESHHGSVVSMTNLSFLRLVGISDPDGVTFSVPGVYTWEQVNALTKELSDGLKHFYVEYLNPLKYTVMLITQ